jgi:hypothetical protein
VSDTALPTPDVAFGSAPFHCSPSITSLAAALPGCQSIIEAAIKDKINPAFKSSYADLRAVWDAIRGPLGQHGFSLIQLPAAGQGRVTVTSILLHKSGEWIASELAMPLTQATPHAVGSAISYARRYAAMSILGVSADDDDANGATPAPHPPQVTPQAQPTPQPSAPAPRAPTPPPAPPQAIPTQTFTAAVTDVQTKSGEKNGKPWTKFGLTFDNGQTAGTFDTKFGQAAQTVAGTGQLCRVEIKTSKDPRFFDILAFGVVGEDEGLGF